MLEQSSDMSPATFPSDPTDVIVDGHRPNSANRPSTTDASANPENNSWKDVWPTPTTTWARYFYIGRWNYVKGLLVAAVIAMLGTVIWSSAAGWTVMGLAFCYIAISGFGLYLLYGPPSQNVFRRLFEMAQLSGEERILDVHFGTYRSSRVALELLPEAKLTAIGVHDPEHETEPAVLDVWKFERPPIGHPRFESLHGTPASFPVDDHSQDIVLLGFGIHEVHSDKEKQRMMGEIRRVLVPHGKVLLFERGWSPLLLFVFGPLFLHFTPAKVWNAWLSKAFGHVLRTTKFGMVDLFVASEMTEEVSKPNGE